jgi:predicted esterase YcpF (UPF0227 family)
MKIIYLHGFASAGNGAKAQALGARFGAAAVVSPDLPIDPREVRQLVDGIIRANRDVPLLLVGTSLGGFYASYFSQRWNLPCVLVNPSVFPSQTVGRRVGVHKNFATGAAFEVRPEFAGIWAGMEAEIAAEQDGALVNLFLAEDDDVISHEVALQHFPRPAFRSVTRDGGHRYQAHWDRVMDRVQEIARARSGS